MNTLTKKEESPLPSNTEQPANAPRSRAAANAANRRIHERIPINCEILICCQSRQGAERRIRARAIDASKSGVLVQTEEPIPSGSVVFLQSSNFNAMGRARVRHCTQKGMKYRLGLYVPDPLVRSF